MKVTSQLLYKLLVRIVMVLLALAIVISATIAIDTFYALKHQYVSKAEVIAESIADSAEDFLVTKDISLIQSYLNQYKKIAGVSYIFIMDSNDTLIAHTFSPIPPAYAYDSNKSDGYRSIKGESIIEVHALILNGALGQVFVGMDLTQIYSDVISTIIRESLLILIISVIGLFLLSRFTRHLVDPLNKLSRITEFMVANKFKLSNEDISKLKDLQTVNDEIGGFSRSFFSLYNQLQEYLVELQKVTKQSAEVNHELALARSIQMNLLGDQKPYEIDPGLFVEPFLEPAKVVGGDFYEVFKRDNLIFITLGDVSGKGISSSLFMSRALTSIQSVSQYLDDPSEIITTVNQQLSKNNTNMLFVTVFFAVINIDDLSMAYVNAGHPNPYLVTKSGELTELNTTNGMVMGIDETAFYSSKLTMFPTLSTLIIYSDGLTEAQNANGELLGEAVIKDTCLEPYGDVSSFKDRLVARWNQFSDGIEKADDCTLVVIQNNRPSSVAITNPLKVHFLNDIQELVKLQRVVDLFSDHYKMDNKEKNTINLVLEELISNTIFYGFNDHDDHYIYVTFTKDENRIQIEVEDDGIPFNPLVDAPDVDASADIDDVKVGGLGIHIIKNMVSDIKYERIDTKNKLIIIK